MPGPRSHRHGPWRLLITHEVLSLPWHLSLAHAPSPFQISPTPHSTARSGGNTMEDPKEGEAGDPIRRRRGCRELGSLSPVPTLYVRAQDTLRETQRLADTVLQWFRMGLPPATWALQCVAGPTTHKAFSTSCLAHSGQEFGPWSWQPLCLSTFVSFIPSETYAGES